jgi:hypothetical protein
VASTLKQRQHKVDGTSKKIAIGWKGGEEGVTTYTQQDTYPKRAAPYTSKRKDPKRGPHHHTRLNTKEPQQNLIPRLGLEEGE